MPTHKQIGTWKVELGADCIAISTVDLVATEICKITGLEGMMTRDIVIKRVANGRG